MVSSSAASSTLAFLALLCNLWLWRVSFAFAGFMADARPAALIVFGDSYADTGNHNASDPVLYAPWRPPYGQTWPGRPSGRFSNGVVLTDEFARYVGVPSPVPYQRIRTSKVPQTATGINFAFGGSGVFPTFGPEYPNISVQISQFQETIARGFFSKKLLPASLALLVVAGNDYTAYRLQHGNNEGNTDFIPTVVAEMAVSLRALYDLGLRSFAVTNLEPFGCFPALTALTNYTSCDATENALSGLHNKLLATQISELQKRLPKSRFTTLDLGRAFKAVLKRGKLGWEACCEAIGNGGCGMVDSRGEHLYSVCSFPDQSFFWDSAHPTQAGWEAVIKLLFPVIREDFPRGH